MNALTHIREVIFGMTQKQFAELLSVNQSTVSRWETGKLHPSRGEMERIRAHARKRGIAWDDRWFFEPPASVRAAPRKRRVA